ncbi:HEPN domain-containing protein [Candidatus Berkelbacteria bacterium]|nr:HEPN domain-containing protein [Candidatus Berkelbacteria bacterium]
MDRSPSQRWLKQAEEDLKTARVNREEERYYAAALFAQQAAEKALKALIIKQTGQLAPKIHDVAELAGGLGLPAHLNDSIERLVPVYLMSRYPDATPDATVPAEFYTDTQAAPLVEAADEVLQWVKTNL